MTWRAILSLAVIPLLSLHRAVAQEQGAKKSTAKIHGAFVDTEGKPIAGVELLSRCWQGAEFSSTSDQEGRFEVKIEWPGNKESTWYEGTARGFGFALWRTRKDLDANGELDLGRIILQPGGALSGRVVDHERKPLAKAFVSVVDGDKLTRPQSFDKKAEPVRGGSVDGGQTKEDGTFRILGVPPGRYWVIAKHERTCHDASAVIDLAAGDELTLPELALDPLPDEFRIEGKVLGPGEKPVVGAKVSTSVPSKQGPFALTSEATTDELGIFMLYLALLPQAPVELHIQVEDKGLDEMMLPDVAAGTRGLVVRLGAMRELHLLVRDSSGKPVENYGMFMKIEKGSYSMRTGEPPGPRPEGRATFRVPDAPLKVEVNAPGYNRKKLDPLGAGPLPKLLEVRLDSLSGVEGSVLYRGAPVVDCHVELVSREPDYLDGVLGERWSGLYYGSNSASGKTDAQGRFLITSDFPRMIYYVRAWKEGHAEGIAGPTQVGGAPVTVELAPGGAVEGRVRLPDGKEHKGLAVELYRRERELVGLENHIGTDFSATVGADGNYRLDHLVPGPWLLRVKVGGTLASDLGWDEAKVAEYEEIPYLVSVDEGVTTRKDIDLTRDEICRLDGRITVGDKISEGYAQLQLEGPIALQLPVSGIEKGGNGSFCLATRDPGRYRLVINAGPGHHQYKVVTDLVDLSPGKNVWEKDIPPERWDGDGIRLDPE